MNFQLNQQSLYEYISKSDNPLDGSIVQKSAYEAYTQSQAAFEEMYQQLQEKQFITECYESLLNLIQVVGWKISILMVIGYWFVMRSYQTERMKVYLQPTSPVFKDIFERTNLKNMKYKPWLLTLNASFQSFMYCIFETIGFYVGKKEYRRELFELSDGGMISLQWLIHPDDSKISKLQRKNRPIMLFLPGLSGDHRNLYCTSMANSAIEHGYDFVIMNYRGMDNVALTTPVIHNAGNTNDTRDVVDYLFKEHCCTEDGKQFRQLFGVGLSLGATILANYVAEAGDECPITACTGIGCMFQSKAAFEHMKIHLCGLYDYGLGICLAQTLIPQVEQHDELVMKTRPDKVLLPKLKKCYTLSEDMSKFCATASGYKTKTEYERDCDTTSRLEKIRVPFFFLSAKDDPFFGHRVIPIDKCYDHIMIGTTRTGGHVGYFEGRVVPTQWWTKPSAEFLNFFRNQSDLHNTSMNNFSLYEETTTIE